MEQWEKDMAVEQKQRALEYMREELRTLAEDIASQAEHAVEKGERPSVIRSELAFYVHDWEPEELIAPFRALSKELAGDQPSE